MHLADRMALRVLCLEVNRVGRATAEAGSSQARDIWMIATGLNLYNCETTLKYECVAGSQTPVNLRAHPLFSV